MADWVRYKVEILDKEFFRDGDGTNYDRVFCKTAKVHFLNQYDEILFSNLYGYISPEEVLNDIHAGRTVCLSECYIKDFTLGLDWFDRTEKKTEISFIGATKAFFDGGIDFAGANFNIGFLCFSDSIFVNGSVCFRDADFSDNPVHFIESNFLNCNIIFDRSSFCKEILFLSSVFEQCNISFSEMRMSAGSLSSINTTYNDSRVTIVFSDIGLIKMRFRVPHEIYFANSTIGKLIFEKAILTDHIDLSQINLITSLQLNDCVLESVLTVDWKKNRISQAVKHVLREPNMSLSEKNDRAANTALLLKENFRKMGRYDDEDNAYVFYRDHQLLSSFWKHVSGKWHKRFNWLWALIWYGLKWIVLGLISGYGTKPLNAILSMIVTWFGFGAFYFWRMEYCEECFKGPSIHEMSNLGKAAFHSAITFLTIGYGDIYPSSQALRIASGLEGFLGLFLMAVFTVSFMRKVLR